MTLSSWGTGMTQMRWGGCPCSGVLRDRNPEFGRFTFLLLFSCCGIRDSTQRWSITSTPFFFFVLKQGLTKLPRLHLDLFLSFWDSILLCSSGWAWMHYVGQAGPKLWAIFLLQPLECWYYRYELPCLGLNLQTSCFSLLNSQNYGLIAQYLVDSLLL